MSWSSRQPISASNGSLSNSAKLYRSASLWDRANTGRSSCCDYICCTTSLLQPINPTIDHLFVPDKVLKIIIIIIITRTMSMVLSSWFWVIAVHAMNAEQRHSHCARARACTCVHARSNTLISMTALTLIAATHVHARPQRTNRAELDLCVVLREFCCNSRSITQYTTQYQHSLALLRATAATCVNGRPRACTCSVWMRLQTAADLWSKQTDLRYWPACRRLGNYTHHRRLSARKPILIL